MAKWPIDPAWVSPEQINNNNTYNAGDGLTFSDLNFIVMNLIYLKKHGSGGSIPIASPKQLGGVQPYAQTGAMTSPVGVDEMGMLWCIEELPYYNKDFAGKFLGVDSNGATNWLTVPGGGSNIKVVDNGDGTVNLVIT